MVEKVAKVRALRDTFMEDLSGMYEQEEIVKEEPEVVQQNEPTETENKEISMSDL